MRLISTVLAGALLSACGGGDQGARGASAAGGGAGAASSTSGSGGAALGQGGMGSTTGGVATTPAGGAGAPASAGSGGGAGTGPREPAAQRTVVYLPDWRGKLSTWGTSLDASRMTYMNLCFAKVDLAGSVSYADTGLDEFVSAAHAKGVKVCLAIGGASVIDDGGPFATVLQPGARDAFVDKLAQYATDHQLDCIDVDLEGNGVGEYYEAFVTSLAPKLHASGKEMTAAVSSWFGQKVSDAAIQAFDFINVMAYDLHNPAGSAQPVQSSSLADATKEVDYWVGRGLAKSKAVFGVPFYGYSWHGAKGEALTYAEILAANPAAATQDQVDLGGATTYLNSRTTIQAKAVLAQQYGGIMIWELGQDAAGEASLLKAIADAAK